MFHKITSLFKAAAALAVLAITFSCSMNAGEDKILSADTDAQSAMTNPMVGLDYSVHYEASSPNPYSRIHGTTGFIKVKNVSPTKLVAVHYSVGDYWLTKNASYSHQGTNGYEYWKFDVSTDVYMYPSSNVLKFAVKYVVNGTEYWDNNSGMNYDGKVDQFTHIKLKTAKYTGVSVAPYTVQNTLEGEVYVKNYAYNKVVNIVYSKRETGSESWGSVACTYVGPGPEGSEIWKFKVVVNTYKGGMEQFCFQYKVNGTEYWDNNLNRNYKVGDFL